MAVYQSGNHFLDDFPRDVGESEIAALVFEGESFVIDPEQAQHGGVQIMHMHSS